WVYEYSVLNPATNSGTADVLALREVGAVDSAEAPSGWIVLRGENEGEPHALEWAAIGTDKSIPKDLEFMRHPVNTSVAPGGTASGFRLLSHKRPGTTPLFAPAFESPVVDGGEDAEPGPFEDIPTMWDDNSVATVLAPGLTDSYLLA